MGPPLALPVIAASPPPRASPEARGDGGPDGGGGAWTYEYDNPA